jgi:hypothetical protein
VKIFNFPGKIIILGKSLKFTIFLELNFQITKKLSLGIINFLLEHFTIRKYYLKIFVFPRENFNKAKILYNLSYFVALNFKIRRKLTLGIIFLLENF